MIFKKLKNLNILVALCFLVLIFATLSVPAFSAYALDYVPLAPIPGTIPTACAEPPCGTTLSTYLTGMFKVGIAIAGVLAFLMIVFGGFTYLSTDAITGKEEGKERIKRALGGLILALAAFIILNTINPTLVNLDLNFGTAAEPGTDLSRPSDLSYSDQLQNRINAVNAVLNDTKRTAQALESAVTDAIIERDAILEALETGEIAMDPNIEERLNMLNQEIGSATIAAQGIRDYNTGKEIIKEAVAKDIDSLNDSSRTVAQREADRLNTVSAIKSQANETASALDVAAQREADATRARGYTNQATEIRMLAAIEEINIDKINALAILDRPNGKSSGNLAIVTKIITEMRTSTENNIAKMTALGLPEKAAEINAAFEAAKAAILAKT